VDDSYPRCAQSLARRFNIARSDLLKEGTVFYLKQAGTSVKTGSQGCGRYVVLLKICQQTFKSGTRVLAAVDDPTWRRVTQENMSYAADFLLRCVEDDPGAGPQGGTQGMRIFCELPFGNANGEGLSMVFQMVAFLVARLSGLISLPDGSAHMNKRPGPSLKKQGKKVIPLKKASLPGVSGPLEVVRIGRKSIYVLGTAHVSRESVLDVERVFSRLKPDVVGVELCEVRHEALRDKDRLARLDLVKIIKERRLALLASTLILSAFQKKIGLETGVKPGSEMQEALQLAEKHSRPFVLADRNVRLTLRRTWHSVGFFSRLYLISYLISTLLFREDLAPEEIERLKSSDVLDDLLDQLPSRYQSLRKIILDERDAYLAEKMLQALELHSSARTFFLVVGAAHVRGIVGRLQAEKRADLAQLEYLPPASPLRSAASWIFFAAVMGALMLVFQRSGQQAALDLAWVWVIGRSSGAGIGAILARAHPLTVLVTIVMAPFAFFIAIFGPRLWMFSTLTELALRKPRFEDFENLAQDTQDWKSVWRGLGENRVLRLLAVAMLVSLGLTLGNVPFWGQLLFNLVR